MLAHARTQTCNTLIDCADEQGCRRATFIAARVSNGYANRVMSSRGAKRGKEKKGRGEGMCVRERRKTELCSVEKKKRCKEKGKISDRRLTWLGCS